MIKPQKKDKVLYEFVVYKTVEETVEISEKNEETGEEIIRKRKEEVQQPIHVKCLRPSRKEIEESEFQYSLKLSECLNRGIMTKQMMYKKYTDTGGLYTNEIFKELTKRYERQSEIRERFTYLASTLGEKDDDQLSEQEKKDMEELQALVAEHGENYQRILEIESEYDALFSHTADKIAETHKLRYFLIRGTMIKEQGDEDYKPLYSVPVDSVSKKMEFNDQLGLFLDWEDQEDIVYLEILKGILRVYQLYFLRPDLSTQESFTEMVELLKNKEEEEQGFREKAKKAELKRKVEELQKANKEIEEALENKEEVPAQTPEEKPKKRKPRKGKIEKV